jgi:hypothetical protein
MAWRASIAGKRRSNRQRKGANWLKTTLVQCALAAAKKKGSYLQAQFHRIKARRGPKKAIMAVVASILTAIYHMLKDGTMYHDLGCDHFKRQALPGSLWPDPTRQVFILVPTTFAMQNTRLSF